MSDDKGRSRGIAVIPTPDGFGTVAIIETDSIVEYLSGALPLADAQATAQRQAAARNLPVVIAGQNMQEQAEGGPEGIPD